MKAKLFLQKLVMEYRQKREVRIQKAEVKSILKTMLKPRKTLTSEESKQIRSYYARFTDFKIAMYWHELYLNAGQSFDTRYIPIDFLFTRIIPRLNNRKFVEAYADKNMYEMLFQNIKHPHTILKRISGDFYLNGEIISDEKAINIISGLRDVIVKPTIETLQGMGVFNFNAENYSLCDMKTKFLEEIGENYIIQEKVVSHPVISSLNPSSLNTIRMVTYRKGNSVKMLSATLKIGKGGELVDNGHAGGFFCGITDDGKLRKYLYTLNPFTKREKTENGITICGIQIPNYQNLKNKVCELALKLPYARYVGWDMTINEAGEAVLIELNLRCPGGNIMQIPNGPLFGDDTESVLDELIHLS